MQHLDRDAVSIHVDAPPHRVYDLVSDVTLMPHFSPELVSCAWVGAATGPEVGARFVAVNRGARGPVWKNTPVVTVAAPGREFAFSRTERFGGTVEWRYLLAEDGDGTAVTESYAVTAPIPRLGWFIIENLFGGRDRRTDLRYGMETTLERLRAVAEVAVP